MRSKTNRLPHLLIALGILMFLLAIWGIQRSWPQTLPLILSPEESVTVTPEMPSSTFTSLTTRGGHAPHFSADGRSLHYITPSGELGYIASLDTIAGDNVLMELPPLARLTWDARDARAVVEWQVSPEGETALDVLDRSKLTLKTLAEGAWGGAWTPDYAYITFIQVKEDGVGLWRINPNGRGAKRLADLSGVVAPEYVAWSALGNRLVVQAAVGAAVYAVDDNIAIQTNWIPWAQQTIWSPDGWTLSFRRSGSDMDTLWTADFDGNNLNSVWEGVFSEARWLPDGRLIYFTPGKEGGAACWALEPRTGTRELLADASVIVWKPVSTFAVSPLGNALAFEAQDRQLWVLHFPIADYRE